MYNLASYEYLIHFKEDSYVWIHWMDFWHLHEQDNWQWGCDTTRVSLPGVLRAAQFAV